MNPAPTVEVPAGTLLLYSDIGCPWASLAVHRLWARRAERRLVGRVRIDHRCFPLELVNSRPTPKRTLDSEVAVLASHEPALGWQPWQGPAAAYPVSTLPALEAVQAAKRVEVGGPEASEALDAALRTAFYAQSRTITLHSVILEVAKGCPGLAVAALDAALREGAARSAIFSQWQAAGPAGVRGSPQVFLPDGGTVHNPGLSVRWTGGPGGGVPRIESDDPSVYDELLDRAGG